MDFEKMQKKDLVALVRKMTQELKSVQKKEKVEELDVDKLPFVAISTVQTDAGKFNFVVVKFDLNTKVAKVVEVTEYDRVYSAMFQARKMLAEKIENQRT